MHGGREERGGGTLLESREETFRDHSPKFFGGLHMRNSGLSIMFISTLSAYSIPSKVEKVINKGEHSYF